MLVKNSFGRINLSNVNMESSLINMIPDITNAIILFGGGLALLHGLAQLLRPGRSVNNLLLSAIFISLTVIQLQEFIMSTTPGYSSGAGMMILLIAKYTLGPTIYLFYNSVFLKEDPVRTGYALHFIPLAIISPVIILVLLAGENSDGILSLPLEFIIENSLLDHLHVLGFALILGYIVAIMSRMEVINVIRDIEKNRLATFALTIIVILFIIISMIALSIITEDPRFSKIALMLISFFVIYWFIMGQIYPGLLMFQTRKTRNQDRVDNLLQTIDGDSLRRRMNEILEKDRLYCDEDLSLKRLADLLMVQPQQLSVYLNHQLNMNLNTFINGYRVKDAIVMMKEEQERPLLSIAFAVGFNSKSVFYEAFTKQTGMSPAKYRKTLES